MYKEPRCKICSKLPEDKLNELNADIESGMRGTEIVKKYSTPELEINANNVSLHKPHILFIPQKLEELVHEALLKGMKPDNIKELLGLITELNKMKDKDCTKCRYKKEDSEKKEFGEVLREFLGEDTIVDESASRCYKIMG